MIRNGVVNSIASYTAKTARNTIFEFNQMLQLPTVAAMDQIHIIKEREQPRDRVFMGPLAVIALNEMLNVEISSSNGF